MNTAPTEAQGIDFFISYTSADRAWAEWIAWQLDNAGYKVRLQAWDFLPGRDFLHEMERAMSDARRTIAILSDDYSKSVFGESEWRTVFAKDPTGEKGLLIPVKVRPCTPPNLLSSRVYIDLTGKRAEDAKDALLVGVSGKGMRPAAEPAFPGEINRSPMFPNDYGPRHEPIPERHGQPFKFPVGRTAIYLPGSPTEGVAFASDYYSTLRELLDDLYMAYLSNQFPPYTYGERWVLRGGNRIIAPISWLSEIGQPIHSTAERWQSMSPFEAGICLNRGFKVCSPEGRSYFGVIADAADVLDVLDSDRKILHVLTHNPPATLTVDEASGLGAAEGVFDYPTEQMTGRVLDLRGDPGAELVKFAGPRSRHR